MTTLSCMVTSWNYTDIYMKIALSIFERQKQQYKGMRQNYSYKNGIIFRDSLDLLESINIFPEEYSIVLGS